MPNEPLTYFLPCSALPCTQPGTHHTRPHKSHSNFRSVAIAAAVDVAVGAVVVIVAVANVVVLVATPKLGVDECKCENDMDQVAAGDVESNKMMRFYPQTQRCVAFSLLLCINQKFNFLHFSRRRAQNEKESTHTLRDRHMSASWQQLKRHMGKYFTFCSRAAHRKAQIL